MDSKMLEGPRAIHLQVTHLGLGREWYSRVLETEPTYEDEKTVTFSLGACLLTLKLADAMGHASTRVYWGVDDLHWEYQRISAIGKENAMATPLIDLHSDKAEVVDPFGNVFGLVAYDDKHQRNAQHQRTAQKLALQNVRQTLDHLQQTETEQKKMNRIIGWVAIFAVLVAVAFAWTLASLQTPAPNSVSKLPIKSIAK
jgi:hypothetical protein